MSRLKELRKYIDAELNKIEDAEKRTRVTGIMDVLWTVVGVFLDPDKRGEKYGF